MRSTIRVLIPRVEKLAEKFGSEGGAFRAILLKYCLSRWTADACIRSPFFATDADSLLSAASALDEVPEEIEPEHFALAYENLFSREHSRKKGIFYTPPHIARHIVSRALDNWGGEKNISILDPACGAGIFLLSVLDLASSVGSEALSRIAPAGIFGVDIDAQAVELSRLLLALKIRLLGISDDALPRLEKNLRQGNSLISPEKSGMIFPDPEFNEFSYHAAFPGVFENGGFDYIVGNPPYGLSRGDQILPRENAMLKSMYSRVLSGKPDKYMLFMARSYELLKEGGLCSFIVPNSWMGIRSGRSLRQMLLSEGALSEIEVLDFPAFEDVSVETVIFRCRKPNADSDGAKTIRIEHLTDSPELGVKHFVEMPTEVCINTPGLTIPLNWDTEASKIVAIVKEHCIALGELKNKLLPLIALQAYATGKGDPPQSESDGRNRIFHRETRESDDCLPYLEGADVKRYSVSWSGKYLKFGPWLAENHPLPRFSGPRVLIREILSPMPNALMCAFIDEPAVYNRSVLHVITGPKGTVEDALSLLAILNSRLASKIIMIFGQKSQRRLFPKLVNDDLKNFPIPRDWSRATSSLAPLALERTQHPASRDLEVLIDRKVDELYSF